MLFDVGIGVVTVGIFYGARKLDKINNIDTILDLDNLVWAQNKAGQHNVTNLQEVVDRLRNVERKV